MCSPEVSNFLILVTFILGYIFIALEAVTHINKATVALLMGVLCWFFQFECHLSEHEKYLASINLDLANISQVVFFLLGALAIVGIIQAHKGFQMISNAIQIRSKRLLLWTVGVITFFLSAVLDNMTTTIVMVSLLTQLLDASEERWLLGGGIIIAANAGGAWSPIGDVTTTMLWIGGQLSTLKMIYTLFLPSLACFVASFAFLSTQLSGEFKPRNIHLHQEALEPFSEAVFFLGIGALIFVPIFKVLTGMPPYTGMLLGLSALWLFTDIAHRKQAGRDHLRVPQILQGLDFSGILFFLGILLAVGALDAAGIMHKIALHLDHVFKRIEVVATLIGIVSAIVDNVPLVAASMSMYDLSRYGTDHPFWELIAYTTGTGGSLLIIGSAAGVVYMGLEKVSFGWYLKRISLAALIGYFAGIAVYLAV